MRHWLGSLVIAAAAIGANAPVHAQCDGQWLAGAPVPGVASAERLPIPFIWAMTEWDSDGAGPNPAVLVVGGEFDTVGSVRADNIAMWDGQSWSSLGTIGPINPADTNPPTRVQAFAVAPNGDLIVGGRFTSADGVQVNNIARWNGSTWSSLGTGVTGGSNGSFPVHAIAVQPNGDIIAAGNFASAGGQFNTDRIARWDGTAWSSVGGGVTNGGTGNSPIRSLLAMPDGDIIAGGWFIEVGGVAASYIARWDADTDTWSPLGTGTDSAVTSLALMPNGDLIAGGEFAQAGGVFGTSSIARWDHGGSWSPLGSGSAPGGAVDELAVMPNGDLIAAGVFNAMDGVPGTDRVARWNPTTGTWAALGEGLRWAVYSSAVYNGEYYAGGDLFGGLGATPPLKNIGRWDGTAWSQVGAGNTGVVSVMEELPNGDIIVGGDFQSIDGVAASRIARWSSTESGWFPLGAGIDNDPSIWQTFPEVIAAMPNGDLVVGGTFISAGGVPGTSRIARWDGAVWHPLGSGVGDNVNALAVLPNGDLIVGGSFTSAGDVPGTSRIARWDGAAWHALGTGTDGTVREIVLLPNGDLIVGGLFTSAGGVAVNRIARWNGSTWSPVGAGFDGQVLDLLLMPNGDIVACGDFTSAGGVLGINRVARWDGSTWSAFGTGANGPRVNKLRLHNGDLIAAGSFTMAGGVPGTSRIARWDGTAWSALGTGVNDIVYDLAASGGVLWVGGVFSHAGDSASTLIARWMDASCETYDAAGPVVISDTTGDGNGNGLAEPGESAVALTLPITRTGVGGATTAITATLTSLTPTVTVIAGESSYAGLVPGATAENSTPFVIAVSPAHPCGEAIDLRLSFSVDGGVCPCEIDYRIAAGVPGGNAVTAWTGPEVVIPDNNPAGVSVPFTVSGVANSIVDVVFRFDNNGVCQSGTASTTPGLTHGTIGQLIVTLTSPQGTSVTLVSQQGGSANHFCNTVFDDEATGIFPNGMTQPHSGSALPLTPLSAFDGENANGVWTLNVADVVPAMIGTLRAFSLVVTDEAVCQPPGGGCPADWNGDTLVNSNDISAFLTAWLGSVQGGTLAADFNGDLMVNSNDISAFLTSWLDAVQNGC